MSHDHSPDEQYAPAAGALSTTTVIHTDDDGLDTQLVTINTPNGDLTAFVAQPEAVTSLPVVLVLPEAFGLHEHIKDIARRFAKEGYLAIAPDLMARQGNPSTFADVPSLVKELLLKIPDAQVADDLEACASWAERAGGDLTRIAVTGFCWGGRWVWLEAARRRYNCAVAWYGIVDGLGSGIFPSDPMLFPKHPIDIAGTLQTPVLGLYGGKDEAIPLASVEKMRDGLRLQGASGPSQIVVFPEAGHAFFADYRASYLPGAANDAWEQCLHWFLQHGMKSEAA